MNRFRFLSVIRYSNHWSSIGFPLKKWDFAGIFLAKPRVFSARVFLTLQGLQRLLVSISAQRRHRQSVEIRQHNRRTFSRRSDRPLTTESVRALSRRTRCHMMGYRPITIYSSIINTLYFFLALLCFLIVSIHFFGKWAREFCNKNGLIVYEERGENAEE